MMMLSEHKGLTRDIPNGDVFDDDEFSEKSYLQPKLYYYLVSIIDEPISLDRLVSHDPNIRPTKGLYTIRYIPNNSYERNPKFPYLIGQDLVRIRITVSGPAHWYRLCQKIPELGWIFRNSTLTKEMFGLAKQHPGLNLKFGINFNKYCSTIMKKAEEQGIDIDLKPLVTYTYNHDVYEKYKDKVFAPRKNKNDYYEELETAKEGIESEE